MGLANLFPRKGLAILLAATILFLQQTAAQEEYVRSDGHIPLHAAIDPEPPRKLSAVLVDKYSGSPLSGATILSLHSNLFLISDSLGRVSFPYSVMEQDESLQVSRVGYRSRSLNAKLLAETNVIVLVPEAAVLEEVVVSSSNPMARVRDLRPGLELVTAAEAKKLPAILGEVDIIKILQLKPGVKNAGEGLAGFYVRGGGSDQNLILLDGVPVYNPNHLLGLFSVFNNDAIRDVRLYKSAYPATYGGRLSSVLDVSPRAGSMDSLRVSGGIGLLSSRLSVETPLQKDRASLIVSGRRTYFDIFTKALNRLQQNKPDYQQIPDYFFSDLNLRADWKINRRNVLWTTAYWGADNFHSSTDDLQMDFTWGNRAAAINWKSVVSDQVEITSSVFYSQYEYQLGNRSGYNDLEVRSGIRTTGAKFVATQRSTGAFRYQAGAEGMAHRLNIGDYRSSSSLGGFARGEKAAGNEWSVFLNTEWDNMKRIAWSGGIRLSGFESEGRWRLRPEPRLVVRVNVSEQAAIKASYTRMSQYLHLASLSTAAMPVDMWYPSSSRTLPQYADQLSLGWSQALYGNSLFLSVDGYYKWMYNQVEFKDGAHVFGNPKLEEDFVYGRANAYGWETYLEKKTGRTTGWLGYTLSWANRIFDDINNGAPFKPRYDRRHDLSLVFMHRINHKFSLSGNWIYGSGAYTTVPVGRFVFQDHAGNRIRSIIPVYTGRSNYQLAAVHRLDLSLAMSLKSKLGEKQIIFSLYNAYSRRNPFYIHFKEIDRRKGYVSSIQPTLVSLFPILPGISYHFKF